MIDEQLDEMGPIDYIVLEWPGEQPHGEVAPLILDLVDRGVIRIDLLQQAESGRRLEVGGVVTHRQRPATASGITFLNLEDESGTLNVIAGVGVWNRYRRIAREAPAMIVRGMLERSQEGVTNLVADRFEPLTVTAPHRSRDFR